MLISKGTSVISTNAFKLLGLTNLVTIRPLPVLITFSLIIFSGRNVPWWKFLEIFSYSIGVLPLVGEVGPYRKIIILLKNTYLLKAISVLMLAFSYYS